MSAVATLGSATASRPVRDPLAARRAAWGTMFALPSFLLLLALVIAPALVLVGLSFTDYRLGQVVTRQVGLANYAAMLQDESVRRSIVNTSLYVAIVLPLSVLGGLGLAMLVHARTRTQSLYEIIYFLPVTSTLVAMATVWQFMFHPNLGLISPLAEAIGLGRVDFLNDPDLAIWAIAILGLWQQLGFNMILFLAGLSVIPPHLYDALAVDGARNPIDRFLRVTWPMVSPTTMFVTITSTVTAFKTFDTVLVLTRGGPLGRTETVLYIMYLEGFHYFRIGYAAALTVAFLAFLILLSIAQAVLVERKVHYS